MFFVNPQSGVPVYRQIMDQVKEVVRAGGLKPGDKLPSLRPVTFQRTSATCSPACQDG